ncbi:MAG: rhodanese-like domain-containing protein [Oligoflexus sp.]
MQHSPGFVKLVEEIRKNIEEIEPAEVEQWLQSGKDFHLVDCRETDEWQAGHIPQAQHLSRGILERDIETYIPKMTDKIVVYCGGGYRSALATANLLKMGYRNVLSMTGGIRQWKEEGRDLQIPSPKASS